MYFPKHEDIVGQGFDLSTDFAVSIIDNKLSLDLKLSVYIKYLHTMHYYCCLSCTNLKASWKNE